MENIKLYKESNDRIADLLLLCEDNAMCLYAGTYIKSLEEQIKSYKDLEEQKKLLKLPCAVGDTVYCIYSRYTKGCEAEECDSKKEYYAQEQKAYSLDWIVTQIVNKHLQIEVRI